MNPPDNLPAPPACGATVTKQRRHKIPARVFRRDPFDPAARRIMHRTQIKGDAPVVAAD